jgi:hypothetical protein
MLLAPGTTFKRLFASRKAHDPQLPQLSNRTTSRYPKYSRENDPFQRKGERPWESRPVFGSRNIFIAPSGVVQIVRTRESGRHVLRMTRRKPRFRSLINAPLPQLRSTSATSFPSLPPAKHGELWCPDLAVERFVGKIRRTLAERPQSVTSFGYSASPT